MPAINFREGGRLGIELNRSQFNYPSDVKNEELLNEFKKIEKHIRDLSVTFSPKILSRAKEKTTAVYIVQLDSAGAVTTGKESMSSLAGDLTESGFKYDQLILSKNVNFLDIDKIRKLVLEDYLGKYDRIIFGVVRLSSFEEVDNLYKVEVSGKVDLFSSQKDILYHYESSTTSRGNNAETVINLTFRSFGKTVALDFIENLP